MNPGPPSPPVPTPAADGIAARAGAEVSAARPWRLEWAVVALALATRLGFVFLLPLRLAWSDARQYEALGRLIADQGTYGLQVLRSPGYPTLIAAVYRAFGPNLLALRIAEALLATLAVALIGRLAGRLFGRRTGLLAMTLAALHPLLSFLPSSQYSESTAALITVLVLMACYAALRRGGVARWAVLGVLLGIQTLVRPNAIALIPGLALAALWIQHRRRLPWLVPAAVTALAFALTLMPWQVRNLRVHHQWFFVSAGGGRSLWLGNNPNASNDTRLDYVFDEKSWNATQTLGELDLDRYFFREAVEFMRANPGWVVRHYFRKLGNFLALFPDPLTRSYVNTLSQTAQGIASVVIYLGVLIALLSLRRDPRLWPIVAACLSFTLATALAFSNVRYRMLIEPGLILLAAYGFDRLLPGRSATDDGDRTLVSP